MIVFKQTLPGSDYFQYFPLYITVVNQELLTGYDPVSGSAELKLDIAAVNALYSTLIFPVKKKNNAVQKQNPV